MGRRASTTVHRYVYQRFVVLSVRWGAVWGTLACYSLGFVPSMASSEPFINLAMWLFVVPIGPTPEPIGTPYSCECERRV